MIPVGFQSGQLEGFHPRAMKAILKSVTPPVYVYNLRIVKDSFDEIIETYTNSGMLNPFCLYYPLFVNPNLSLVKRVLDFDERIGLFVNSREELTISLDEPAVPRSKVLFSGGVISSSDIDFLSEQDILMASSSIGNLEQACRNKRVKELALRIDFSGTALKGIRYFEVAQAFEIAQKHAKRIVQIQAYPGTNILREDALIQHAATLLKIWKEFPSVRTINLSGGFGYDYSHINGKTLFNFHSYFRRLRNLVASYEISDSVTIALECGRVLLARAGILLVSVIETRKDSLNQRTIFVDSSFTHMPSAKIHNQMHMVIPLTTRLSTKESDELHLCRIAGTTTLSSDLLLPDPALLPDMEAGEYLAILDTGAYGRAPGYNFLGKALPAEILLDDDKIFLIRKTQSPVQYLGHSIEEEIPNL